MAQNNKIANAAATMILRRCVSSFGQCSLRKPHPGSASGLFLPGQSIAPGQDLYTYIM